MASQTWQDLNWDSQPIINTISSRRSCPTPWRHPWIFFLTFTSVRKSLGYTFQTPRIQQSITISTASILIQTKILFYLEYCNRLLIRFPASASAAVTYSQHSCWSERLKTKIKFQKLSISLFIKKPRPTQWPIRLLMGYPWFYSDLPCFLLTPHSPCTRKIPSFTFLQHSHHAPLSGPLYWTLAQNTNIFMADYLIFMGWNMFFRKICWSLNPWYPWMWPDLKIRSL